MIKNNTVTKNYESDYNVSYNLPQTETASKMDY